MCCTSRKETRVKYTYTPSASPWNQPFLYSMWLFQLIACLSVTAIGIGLLPLKSKEYRQDDGLSNAFYMLAVFTFAGTTLTFVGFLVLQVYWYKNHELHPGWALGCNSYMMVLYALVIGMVATDLTYASGFFNGFEVVLLGELVCCVSGFILFCYHCQVNNAFRASNKRARDIELQNGPQ